jgi:DNA-binding CsgD family transcriptional regulator
MSLTALRSLRDRRGRAALTVGTVAKIIARRWASATTVERHAPHCARSIADDPTSGSPRELDVLQLVVAGHCNNEIAIRHRIHQGSVERHVTSLQRKAKCESRAGLVARFWRMLNMGV